jgi:subtilisin-like proprotein convertase family protein
MSPMGTESLLLPRRVYDNVTDYTTSIFMSVHNWGEDPNGEWALTIYPVYEGIGKYFHSYLDCVGLS